MVEVQVRTAHTYRTQMEFWTVWEACFKRITGRLLQGNQAMAVKNGVTVGGWSPVTRRVRGADHI